MISKAILHAEFSPVLRTYLSLSRTTLTRIKVPSWCSRPCASELFEIGGEAPLPNEDDEWKLLKLPSSYSLLPHHLGAGDVGRAGGRLIFVMMTKNPELWESGSSTPSKLLVAVCKQGPPPEEEDWSQGRGPGAAPELG